MCKSCRMHRIRIRHMDPNISKIKHLVASDEPCFQYRDDHVYRLFRHCECMHAETQRYRATVLRIAQDRSGSLRIAQDRSGCDRKLTWIYVCKRFGKKSLYIENAYPITFLKGVSPRIQALQKRLSANCSWIMFRVTSNNPLESYYGPPCIPFLSWIPFIISRSSLILVITRHAYGWFHIHIYIYEIFPLLFHVLLAIIPFWYK